MECTSDFFNAPHLLLLAVIFQKLNWVEELNQPLGYHSGFARTDRSYRVSHDHNDQGAYLFFDFAITQIFNPAVLLGLH